MDAQGGPRVALGALALALAVGAGLYLRLSSPGGPSSPTPAAARCAPVTKLVFEGGGVKGVAYGGAAAALEETGELAGVTGVAGTSAGSQVAALLAAGYTGRELIGALVSIDFGELTDTSGNGVKDLERLFTRFGFFKGDALEARIDELLSARARVRNVTFAQLYALTRIRLRIPATCVTNASLVWFDHTSAPTLPVARAVRASSAVPFFYAPVQIDGRLYVDGGLLRNLPVDAFAAMPPDGGRTLALLLARRPGEREVRTLGEFALQVVDTMMWGPDSANSIHRGQAHSAHAADAGDDGAMRLWRALVGARADAGGGAAPRIDVVDINTTFVGAGEFGLSAGTKASLVRAGYEAVRAYADACRTGGRADAEAAAAGATGGRIAEPEPEWLRQLEARAAELDEEALAGTPEGFWRDLREQWAALQKRIDEALPSGDALPAATLSLGIGL